MIVYVQDTVDALHMHLLNIASSLTELVLQRLLVPTTRLARRHARANPPLLVGDPEPALNLCPELLQECRTSRVFNQIQTIDIDTVHRSRTGCEQRTYCTSHQHVRSALVFLHCQGWLRVTLAPHTRKFKHHTGI